MTTIKETAERIVDGFGLKDLLREAPLTSGFRPIYEVLIERIESALLAERERCAKIAEDYDAESDGDPAYASGSVNASLTIATAIRSDEE